MKLKGMSCHGKWKKTQTKTNSELLLYGWSR